MKLFQSSILISSLIVYSAFADEIRLGHPAHGGSGCPAGTLAAVLGPDQKTISIQIDDVTAHAGEATGRMIDRKSCSLTIPIHIPAGISIAFSTLTFQGFNHLPTGGSSSLVVNTWFANQSHPSYSKRFFGALNQEYKIDTSTMTPVWSPCGGETTLRIQWTLMAQTNIQKEQSMMTLGKVNGIQILQRQCE